MTEHIAIETIVVLYFLLFLFMFLYETIPPIPHILPMNRGVLNFSAFNFISFVFLIASSGVTFAAFRALPIAEKYIVITARSNANTRAGTEILKTSAASSHSDNIIFATFVSTYAASTPLPIPIGIPTIPSIAASVFTLFLICLFVAPMLESIPYCLIFSVIDILKLFFMQYTEVSIIINATIAAITKSALNNPSIGYKHSYLIRESFCPKTYFTLLSCFWYSSIC